MYSEEPDIDLSSTAFRKAEKKYKFCENINPKDKKKKQRENKNSPFNPTQISIETAQDLGFNVEVLKDVIDFQNIENNTPENKKRIIVTDIESFKKNHPTKHPSICEMNPKTDMENLHSYFQLPTHVYSLYDVPGLYFFPSVLSIPQQRYWIKRALKLSLINPTNISTLKKQREEDQQKSEAYPQEEVVKKSPFSQIKELRWSSVGYTFQWTKREYKSTIRSDFPSDLYEMTRSLARNVGYDMYPEAAIINYYTFKSSMGAHLDDAEEEMSTPIVSYSLGCTCIFLIGGKSRDDEPKAFYLRSGDVMMLAEHSRYCYHAVPKIFKHSCSQYLISSMDPLSSQSECKQCNCSKCISIEKEIGEEDEEEWKKYQSFIYESRVNINCRQVYKKIK